MDFFGEQIKKERQLANMTVAELATKARLSEQVIMNLEDGTMFPDVRHLMTLARAFGKHNGYFLTKLVYRQ